MCSIFRIVLKTIFSVIAVLACFLTLAGLLGVEHWALELTTHFRQQYFWVLLMAIGFISFSRFNLRNKTIIAMVLFIFLCINVKELMPYYLPVSKAENRGSKNLSVLHLNIFAPNRDYQRVKELVEYYEPDLVEIMEYKEDSRVGLESTGAFKNYPYKTIGKAHIGIYSKYPIKNTNLQYATNTILANYANLTMEIDLGNATVNLLVAHPHWPVMKNVIRQKKHFDSWIKTDFVNKQNVVLMADLNTSPWSSNFKYLIRESGLKDSQLGKGIQPSWPVFIPHLRKYGRNLLVSLFRIPIDHILVSKDITVLKRELGADVGSDHLPVYAELAIPVSSSH